MASPARSSSSTSAISPPILSFCRHLTGRLEDAEDAVQHTFLSAYRAITATPTKRST